MRAATALNLRAVLKSSEKRHMSSPTLIVSHKTVSMNCSRSSRLHFIAQQSNPNWRSVLSGQRPARDWTTTLKQFSAKWIAKRTEKLAENTKDDFPFPLCGTHTRTRPISFPFVSLDLAFGFLPSQSHTSTSASARVVCSGIKMLFFTRDEADKRFPGVQRGWMKFSDCEIIRRFILNLSWFGRGEMGKLFNEPFLGHPRVHLLSRLTLQLLTRT